MRELNGSWAAAFVGDRQGITLGRDIAGAQTMYYGKVKNTLYFTSSLTLFRTFSFTINPEAVSSFLHFLYVPAPLTIFKELNAVLPGQIISFNGETFREDQLPARHFGEQKPAGAEVVVREDPSQPTKNCSMTVSKNAARVKGRWLYS